MDRNWLRRIAPFALISAVLTAVLFAVVEFSPAAGLGERLLVIVFAWAFIGFAVHAFADLAKVPGDLRQIFKQPNRPKATVAGVFGAAKTTAGVIGNAIAPPNPVAPYTPPEPTDAELAEVEAALAPLAAAGVFQPQVPDPALVFAGVADCGEPITPEAIFNALNEMHYYHPDADAADYMANLAFVDSKTEQSAELLSSYIADFDALTDGALAITVNAIDHPPFAEADSRDVIIDLVVSGAPLRVQYRGGAKYLSTYLHVALAKAYQALGRGDAIATFWTDQGVWLTRLHDGAVATLNAALGLDDPDSPYQFGWLHAEEPFAAGDPVTPPA
jgi:hypothetical protein